MFSNKLNQKKKLRNELKSPTYSGSFYCDSGRKEWMSIQQFDLIWLKIYR